MVRKSRWYDQWHIYPNGPAPDDGATSATGVDSEDCVTESSSVSASEPGAMQGYGVGYGCESTTRMGEKPVTPPLTAAVINGNGISSHSSDSDTALLSNCSSDPVEQMTNTCDPAGPKKRWRNKYRFKKRNKVLEKPGINVAPQLPPQEKEDWSNDIQEVPKTVCESQSYAGVINGDGISSHSSEPDTTNSDTAVPNGSDLVAPRRRAGDRRRHNKFKWKKRQKKDLESEYPAWNFPVAPRLELQEEEDWEDEIEEFAIKLYESLPYEPEDILKSELQGLRLYPNTSPIPALVDNYIPASHHQRPLRWTCSSLSTELDQFEDASE